MKEPGNEVELKAVLYCYFVLPLSSMQVSFVDLKKEHGNQAERELRAQYGADKVNFYYCDVTSHEQLTGMNCLAFAQSASGTEILAYTSATRALIPKTSKRTYISTVRGLVPGEI